MPATRASGERWDCIEYEVRLITLYLVHPLAILLLSTSERNQLYFGIDNELEYSQRNISH